MQFPGSAEPRQRASPRPRLSALRLQHSRPARRSPRRWWPFGGRGGSARTAWHTRPALPSLPSSPCRASDSPVVQTSRQRGTESPSPAQGGCRQPGRDGRGAAPCGQRRSRLASPTAKGCVRLCEPGVRASTCCGVTTVLLLAVVPRRR